MGAYNNSNNANKKTMLQLPKAFLNFLIQIDGDGHIHLDEKENDDRDAQIMSIHQEQSHFATLISHVSHKATSVDGTTTKLAVKLQNNNHSKIRDTNNNKVQLNDDETYTVETVIMRHGNRTTLCVSSQVGCAMGCTFCATGTMGIRGNLTSGEILEQIVHAENILHEEARIKEEEQAKENLESVSSENINTKRKKNKKKYSGITNVVFMGMGEPLNNYKNVVSAVKGLMDRRRWNLAHSRICVSTVGVIPKMRQLTKDLPQICLALSLHAPNQKMRTEIVPTATKYPI